jgi:hypothetical protein
VYRQDELNVRYAPQKDDERLCNYIETITSDYLHERSDWGHDSTTPIFVVGFPRSGTSLVEQILASHSQVRGAGELKDIERIELNICNFTRRAETEHALRNLTGTQLNQLAEKYLNRLRYLSDEGARIVDKMPHNFRRVWIISLMFPNATIVHTMRNPLDTCVSCFSTNFTKGHPYTDNLSHLGHHYGFYSKLMGHWHDVSPVSVHNVVYEDLVTNPESQIHHLLEGCGLDFEEACMRFHQTQRRVATASSAQVRQKIYTSSIGKWRNYEKHLDPLIEALEEQGVDLDQYTSE